MALQEKILTKFELSDAEFEEISDFIMSVCGINLHEGKRELVKARLSKRLRTLGVSDFREYLQYVQSDETGSELTSMLDVISTNLTCFFREAQHFTYLKDSLIPSLAASKENNDRRLRIWSAGCSSGEEPYSIAISLLESLPNASQWDARILATDLSTRVLARAREGLYDAERLKGMPAPLVSRYFHRLGGQSSLEYGANETLRKMIHYARVNLMDSWPMKGPFDAIFCRNVMIYFDKPTQAKLIKRFQDLLAEGGIMFIGHSESLAGIKHDFQYVQPAVYKKRR
jgi:chemotaxis protein methyltransferase CheR